MSFHDSVSKKRTEDLEKQRLTDALGTSREATDLITSRKETLTNILGDETETGLLARYIARNHPGLTPDRAMRIVGIPDPSRDPSLPVPEPTPEDIRLRSEIVRGFNDRRALAEAVCNRITKKSLEQVQSLIYEIDSPGAMASELLADVMDNAQTETVVAVLQETVRNLATEGPESVSRLNDILDLVHEAQQTEQGHDYLDTQAVVAKRCASYGVTEDQLAAVYDPANMELTAYRIGQLVEKKVNFISYLTGYGQRKMLRAARDAYAEGLRVDEAKMEIAGLLSLTLHQRPEARLAIENAVAGNKKHTGQKPEHGEYTSVKKSKERAEQLNSEERIDSTVKDWLAQRDEIVASNGLGTDWASLPSGSPEQETARDIFASRVAREESPVGYGFWRSLFSVFYGKWFDDKVRTRLN